MSSLLEAAVMQDVISRVEITKLLRKFEFWRAEHAEASAADAGRGSRLVQEGARLDPPPEQAQGLWQEAWQNSYKF